MTTDAIVKLSCKPVMNITYRSHEHENNRDGDRNSTILVMFTPSHLIDPLLCEKIRDACGSGTKAQLSNKFMLEITTSHPTPPKTVMKKITDILHDEQLLSDPEFEKAVQELQLGFRPERMAEKAAPSQGGALGA